MEKNKLVKTVEAAQHGDESAISRLYTEYAEYVYRLAFKLTGNKEDAEDVMQNVFMLVLRKINELRKPAAFEGWLRKITLNSSVAALKKRINIVGAEDILGMQEETEIHVLPERALDGKETLRIIGETVDALPAGQRMCVYYHYYGGLTAPKIAELIDENINTVKSRISRAKKKIRSELKRIEKEEGIKLRGVIFMPIASALKLSVVSVDAPSSIIQSVWNGIIAASGESVAETALKFTIGTTGIKPAVLLAGVIVTAGIGVGIYFGTDLMREVTPELIIETDNTESETKEEPENIADGIDLSAFELLGYEIHENGGIVLSVNFEDTYVFDPDKFRDLFFGIWEHDGEIIKINDSQDIDIGFSFVSGEIGRRSVKGEVYYTIQINGGVSTVFWIDTGEPDIMYVNVGINAGNINTGVDFETWTRTSLAVTEPEENYLNDMRLKEFALERGIDPDMLIHIASDWGQRSGNRNSGWCFPTYLISEEDEKIILSTFVRESLGDEEVEITYALEKTDGEWVQMLYSPMPETAETI